jgi:pimeloyl-ACP methyl ester carboxylesterase
MEEKNTWRFFVFTFDFKLTTGDQNVGTVYLPSNDVVNIPVIIYCHGWGGNRALYPTIEQLRFRAEQENIAIVAFDFYGCGDTGGNYALMTYTRWKENLSDIVTWIISQPFSNKDKIGCFSLSSGTTASLRMAAEGRRLSFIISVATCASAHFGMDIGGPAKVLADNLEYLISGGTAKIFGVDFSLDFFVDTISRAPIHTISQIQCPVLFLQGTADNTFRCADAKMAYDLMKDNNPVTKTEYTLIDGGNHGLDNAIDTAVEKIFEWLMPILSG